MNPHNTIGAELGMLANLIKRQTALPLLPGEEWDIEVTRTHGMIIGFLMEHDGSALQKEIEEQFSIRRSTVSRVLKLMEKKGLITRGYLEEDARLKRIELTPRAKELYAKIAEHIQQVEKKLLKGVTEEEKVELYQILGKMIENLKD